MAARKKTPFQRRHEASVLDFIEQHPGAHSELISRELRMSTRYVVGALRRLERRSQIYCVPDTLIGGARVTAWYSNRLKETMEFLCRPW